MTDLLFAGNADVPAGWDARFGDFLTDLFFQEGLAESTLRTLQIQLRAFNTWLLEATGRSWEYASEEDLHAFLLSWHQTRSVSTMRVKQWMLRRLYDWARDDGIASLKIARALLPLRNRFQARCRPPSQREIARLLEQPDTSTAQGIRDRAVLEMLYGMGLRAAELLEITVDQAPATKSMQIWGKGSKERLAVVGEHAQYWMAQYKVARQALLAAGGHSPIATAKLFVSSGRYPDYRYFQLRRMVARYGLQCGIRVTPHLLRHAFATHLYQGRAPLNSIRLLLGHEYLETTARYVSRHQEDDRLLVATCHPRGNRYVPFRRW